MGDRQYHRGGGRGGYHGGGGGGGGPHNQGGGGYRGGRGGGGGNWHGEHRGGGRGGYGGRHGGHQQHQQQHPVHFTPQPMGQQPQEAEGRYQRSYLGSKRGREDEPQAANKLPFQHILVAKLLGLCDRNTQTGRDAWPDERFFDDILKSCRRDLEQGGEHVASLLPEAAVEVTFKTQHYALVLGILNAERPDFSSRVVRGLVEDLQACCDSGRNQRAKQLMRFLGALHAVNAVPASWLLGALGALADAALGAAAAGADPSGATWQPWADYLVYVVLATLPWCGRDLAGVSQAQLDAEAAAGQNAMAMDTGEGRGGEQAQVPTLTHLLEKVEAYMGARPVTEDAALRPMFGSRGEGDLAARSDSGGASFLGQLWEAVAECRDAAWTVATLPGPHTPYLEKLAAARPVEGLPALVVPAAPAGVDPGAPAPVAAAQVRAAYPPRGGIRLLSRDYLEGDLPPLERFIVEEYILDVLSALSGDRTACVLTLAQALPHHLAHVFGGEDAAQRGNVRNFVAETLFGQMLALPRPKLSHAAYCTLLVDLCKVPSFQFARALSSCVRELFACTPHLDPELRGRLVSWLSYHLSSFGFQWPWDRWQWVTQRPPADPQRCLCTALLHRLLRLSYYEAVQQSLPPYFRALLGPKPSGPALPGSQANPPPAQAPGPAAGQQPAAAGGKPNSRRGSATADIPDMLEDAMEVSREGAEGGDGDAQQQQQQQQQQQEEAAAAAAALAAADAADPLHEAASRLVGWARAQGRGLQASNRGRNLRPEQVAAACSEELLGWLGAQGGEELAEGGPLAAIEVTISALLALGDKSPSHLHVAVERYAGALRTLLAQADAAGPSPQQEQRALEDEGAAAALRWQEAAVALGASRGQMAMLQVAGRYYGRMPQKLLLVVDRLMALHVLDAPSVVAWLFSRPEMRSFADPVPCGSCWELLLYACDRALAQPRDLAGEVADWDKTLGKLQAQHQALVAAAASGLQGMEAREREAAAQIEQAGACAQMLRWRLENSGATAQNTLLTMYLGFVRMLEQLPELPADDEDADEDAEMQQHDEGEDGGAVAEKAAAREQRQAERLAAAQARTLACAWLTSALRRYALPSSELGGRLREEVLQGRAPPAEFAGAVAEQLHVQLD